MSKLDWTKPMSVVIDAEGNNLLNNETIDYTKIPYKLKDNFKLHCIVVELPNGTLIGFHDGPKYIFDGRRYEETIEGVTYVLENYAPLDYIHRPMSAFPEFVKNLPEGSTVIGHNIINFDLLAFKLYFGIPYEIETDMSVDAPLGMDTWGGKHIIFDDTLVRSKTLNPDRFGGHSLEALSKGGADEKRDFRLHIPAKDRFKHFAADMLYYNIFDDKSNRGVAHKLDMEMLEFDWKEKWHPAIKLEKAVMDVITRQSHRGFKFDKDLAQKSIAELDEWMEERRARIEAILPDKPATKGFMDDYTPPKNQFKKNGELSAHMQKFVEKLGATVEGRKLVFNGREYQLPLPQEPLIQTMKACVDDTTHIKDWLVSKGWRPQEYKEKDLTVDSKKIKLTQDKLDKAIDRYVQQTITTNFMRDRIEHLGVQWRKGMPPTEAERKLRVALAKRLERAAGVKVLTNPSFTVGQEKEICPDLSRLAQSDTNLACITDIVEYLTYRHRRNSILGGGKSFEDFEEEDEDTARGFLANVRDDGRIPTPADTCGAATSRMKHRGVANVPRVTSLYGAVMRAQFGVDEDCWQIGYDFDSLEARDEAHYCWDFEAGDEKEYCSSLLKEKPFDVHTMMAKKISIIIAREFGRSPAKNVKYGCTYGAQAAKVAKTIGSDLETGKIVFDAFWEAAAPLKGLKTALQAEWGRFSKRRIIGLDGRLVPTRSAHAILNSKFQSAGVIAAKRTMVLHDRWLRAEGLLIDFFVDSLEGREWCQQLIAYHDEAQAEVSKKSMKFKRFSTKEEAQAFKDEQLAAGKIWSDIKPSPRGGVFVAYCRAGELAVQAVTQSGRDLGMKVDLTAGYMVGRNWAECH